MPAAPRLGSPARALLCMVLCSAAAHGQEAGSEPPRPPEVAAADPAVDEARRAFVLGADLARQERWPEALAEFERSAALRPHAVTTYNVAYSERALGHSTRAYKLFRKSLAEHESGTSGTLPDDLLASLRSYVSELEQRLARAVVHAPAGGELAVDGHALEAAPGAAATPVFLSGTTDGSGRTAVKGGDTEVLLDSGEHVFVLSTPGSPDSAATATFAPGESRRVVLEPAARHVEPKPVEPARVVVEPKVTTDRTWVYVAYGVGGAGIAAGSVFGVLALGGKSELDGHRGCPGSCPLGDRDSIDAMKRDALLSTIGFAIGVAGAGLGTFLLFTEDGSEGGGADRGSVSIEPRLGLGALGAAGRF